MDKKGFTLIEILVYVAVLAIITSASFSFILWAVHSNSKVKAMRETLYNARRAMEIMTYEIKKAKSISSSSTATRLCLENDFTTEFYLCGTTSDILCQKRGLEDPIFLTSDKVEVNNLEFTQIATTSPSVQVNLKIDYKNPDDRPEYRASVNVTSTASLRSY